MTFAEYLTKACAYYRDNPVRFGQALFNVLDDVRPDLADAIVSTALDPFHLPDDDKDASAEFLTWASDHWNA